MTLRLNYTVRGIWYLSKSNGNSGIKILWFILYHIIWFPQRFDHENFWNKISDSALDTFNINYMFLNVM